MNYAFSFTTSLALIFPKKMRSPDTKKKKLGMRLSKQLETRESEGSATIFAIFS